MREPGSGVRVWAWSDFKDMCTWGRRWGHPFVIWSLIADVACASGLRARLALQGAFCVVRVRGGGGWMWVWIWIWWRVG